MLKVARERRGQQAFYVSTSIKRAVSTVWDELVLLNEDHRLGGQTNLTLHTIQFPTGGKLTVTGVEDKTMANDLRGRPRVALYFIDECQDWKDDLLRYFYENVVYPSLADVRGSVVFAGTGGAPRGFWHEIATYDPGFERFEEWTIFDNPFLPPGEAQNLVDKACRDRGCTVDDPSIQREFFGRFVTDTVRQIFPYDDAKNGYNDGEIPAGKWSYALAGDFGTVDAAAGVVWGWTPHDPHLWVIETQAVPALGASAQVELMRSMASRYEGRGLVASVGDPGGGGKGLIVDLRQEHLLAMEPAEKTGKASACIMMRDGLRSGKIKIPRREKEFIAELQQPEWDPDRIGEVIRGHMPDRIDAALYGYRRASTMHHYHEAPPVKTEEQRQIEAIIAAQEAEERVMRDLGVPRIW